ncbi:MAG: LCP family protein, partial [Atopobiaceae bacterium]|nr:LCP family protein [Atopobiaceae bacterium]
MSIDEGERESLQDALAQAADPVTGTSSAPARPESSAFYALLVGSDERDGLYGARGDVLVLVRVDLDNSVIHLVSIPRDTMVTIPGVIGTQKINASYHLGDGGAARAVRTISEFTGVPIS